MKEITKHTIILNFMTILIALFLDWSPQTNERLLQHLLRTVTHQLMHCNANLCKNQILPQASKHFIVNEHSSLMLLCDVIVKSVLR